MKNLKKKKPVLVLLLAAVMLFSSMSSSLAADNTISSTYFVNQDFSQLASLSKINTWYQVLQSSDTRSYPTNYLDDQNFGWKTTEQTEIKSGGWNPTTATYRLMEGRSFAYDKQQDQNGGSSYGLYDGKIEGSTATIFDNTGLTQDSYMVETNSWDVSAIYQDIKATPGASYTYSFYHGGRANGEDKQTLAVVIGPARTSDGGYNTVANYTSGTVTDGSGNSYELGNNSKDFFNTVYSFAAGVLNISSADLEAGYTIPDGNGDFSGWYVQTSTVSAGYFKADSGSYTAPADAEYLTMAFVSTTTSGNYSTYGNIVTNVNLGIDVTVTYTDSSDVNPIQDYTYTVGQGSSTPNYASTETNPGGTTPTKTGKIFLGWSKDDPAGAVVTPDATVSRNTTYYAQWADAATLTVSKTVDNPTTDSDSTSFSYTAKFTDSDNNPLTGTYTYQSADGTVGTVTLDENGEASFDLTDGQNVVFTVPAGTSYTVTETENSAYTASNTIDGTASAAGSVAEGTLSTTAGTTAAFTNTLKTGGFAVSKTVTGNTAETSRYFSYTVTLKGFDGTCAVKYYDADNNEITDLADGQPVSVTSTAEGTDNTITLKSGQRFEITGMPAGSAYAISEAAVDGYTQTMKKDGTDADVTVTDTQVTADTVPVYAYTNSSSAAPATSYTQNDTPFMLFIAGVGAVGIAIILKMRFGLKV